ncbi:DUF6807 family protein [Nesterenkonia lutea]|uniref:Dehydrogenase n=1 Tax=Nesterenkonia lutea TaxID=272919 RepID=A0ABR9JH62_9MICC|nr:DUF6807 family protein [Nesterenkonia lutea]MBE1525265.1 putative dehydrogenase [Nesterenkonia lutea]
MRSAHEAAPAAVRTDDAVRTVVLIGLDGFGRQHLLNLARLATAGRAKLIAGVSFSDPGPEVRGEIPVYQTLAEARRDGHHPDVVIVSTPINTHYELAAEALRSGADVLLEKPPTATLEQFTELLEVAEESGGRVQVGFQSLGSHALPAIAELLAGTREEPGPIGELRAVGATGLWVRTVYYYQRSPWAGKREMDGVPVVDGVVTNPLAHAVKTALHIAGAKTLEDVAELSTELHHAHDIEADDTSIVQLRTASGIPVTAALTLCAAEQQDPWITISGTEGEALFYYTRDELVVHPNPQRPGYTETGPQTYQFERTDLLENLIDVQQGARAADGDPIQLLSPLASHGAFMRVLEAVRTAKPPAAVPAEHQNWVGSGVESHPVLLHIEEHLARAVKAAPSSFSSLGVPWAAAPASSGQLDVVVGAERRTVADLRTGTDISPTDSPRPFLDEVRTIGGVVVTDQQPLDHTWHLGVGVALQDVNGTNFWGGRTYTRDAGRYIWREDHGRIETAHQELADTQTGQRVSQQLSWIDAAGHTLLREQREITVGHESDLPSGWAMDFNTSLSPAGEETVSLGSPGSNGRLRGGYGGFFWRLPAVGGAEFFTAEASGEEAVHGSLTDWLAVSAEFLPLPSRAGSAGPATLIFLRGTENPDPWFVRHESYPGVGMSLAWEKAVPVRPGESVQRGLRVLILDGRLSREEVAGHVR